MKRKLAICCVIILAWSCHKEEIDQEKYVIPIQLTASRDGEGIMLKWYPYLTEYLKNSTNIYLPNAVEGTDFRLFYAADDTLDFRHIRNFTLETDSLRFVPEIQAKNYFFRMDVYAGKARPAKTLIQVQLGNNPPVTELTEYPYDYNSAIGNFDPDDRFLVFSRNYDRAEEENCCTGYSLFLCDVRTGETAFLFEDAYNPNWSPDGGRIVFSSGFGLNEFPQSSNLGLYDFDSDSVIRLTSGVNEFRRPLWSPDGSRIIFLSDISNDSANDYWEVFGLDLSSGEWGPVYGTNSPEVLNLPYSLSPDGNRIAFVDYSANGIYSIWRFDLETGTTRPEVESGWHDYNPSWSPDGKYMAFLSYRSGKPEIWIKTLSTGELRQVTGVENIYIDSELVWSRDSHRIYFKLYRGQVFGIYFIEI